MPLFLLLIQLALLQWVLVLAFRSTSSTWKQIKSLSFSFKEGFYTAKKEGS
nr:hypothetical protein Q903MT_gene664 [Picea sitchensis]